MTDSAHADRRQPDPTALTTQQLNREIAALKELVFVRLDAMDNATALFHANVTRVPTDTDRQIQHLQALMSETFALQTEKFTSVQTQFTERDTRTEQTSRDSKVAVDAALQAAKEAVGEQNKSSALAIAKSETSTTKQIDQIGALINTSVAGINLLISDLKDRVQRIESEDRGEKTAGKDQQVQTMSLVSVVGLVIGSLVGIAGLILALLGRHA